jgi:hypothetical protein
LKREILATIRQGRDSRSQKKRVRIAGWTKTRKEQKNQKENQFKLDKK